MRELVGRFADHVCAEGGQVEASGKMLRHKLRLPAPSPGPREAAGGGGGGEAGGNSAPSNGGLISGRIAPEAVAEARETLRRALLDSLDDEEAFGEWFGSLVTKPKRVDGGETFYRGAEGAEGGGSALDVAAEALRDLEPTGEGGGAAGGDEASFGGMGEGAAVNPPVLMRELGVKFAFIEAGLGEVLRRGMRGGGSLFADGEVFRYPACADQFVRELCARSRHRDPIPTSLILATARASETSGPPMFPRLLGELILGGFLFLE